MIKRKGIPQMEDMGEILLRARNQNLPMDAITEIFRETFDNAILDVRPSPQNTSNTEDESRIPQYESFSPFLLKFFHSLKDASNQNEAIEKILAFLSFLHEDASLEDLEQLTLSIDEALENDFVSSTIDVKEHSRIFANERLNLSFQLITSILKKLRKNDDTSSNFSETYSVSSFIEDVYLYHSNQHFELEELDLDEEILGFFHRFSALEAGGHFPEAVTKGPGFEIPDFGTNHLEEIEVDLIHGLVNKDTIFSDSSFPTSSNSSTHSNSSTYSNSSTVLPQYSQCCYNVLANAGDTIFPHDDNSLMNNSHSYVAGHFGSNSYGNYYLPSISFSNYSSYSSSNSFRSSSFSSYFNSTSFSTYSSNSMSSITPSLSTDAFSTDAFSSSFDEISTNESISTASRYNQLEICFTKESSVPTGKQISHSTFFYDFSSFPDSEGDQLYLKEEKNKLDSFYKHMEDHKR